MPQAQRFGQFANQPLRVADEAPKDTVMPSRSPHDNPDARARAWARYKQLMRWMMLITVTMVIGALVLLYRENGLVSIHFYIATALGIGFAMLLTSALMGLVFLSSGSGHDDAVADSRDDGDEKQD